MKKCIECQTNVVDHHRTLFCKECFNKFTEDVNYKWKKEHEDEETEIS